MTKGGEEKSGGEGEEKGWRQGEANWGNKPPQKYIYCEKVDENLLCPICYEPFVSPVCCPDCGNVFCSQCLFNYLQAQKSCPNCRSSIEKGIATRPIRSMCDALLVQCNFEKCNWTGQRERLAEHASNCEFRLVSCCHGCITRLTPDYKKKHEESCGWREILCECGEKLREYELAKHKSNECTDSCMDAMKYEIVRLRKLLATYESVHPDLNSIRQKIEFEEKQTKQLSRALQREEGEEKEVRQGNYGDTLMQLHLGEYFVEREKNFEEGVRWYRKAAKQGNARAQTELGNCYYLGIFMEKNYDKAIKWYRKAAEQGNAAAQQRLGEFYHFGYGVEKNSDESTKWFRKAAEQEDTEVESIEKSDY